MPDAKTILENAYQEAAISPKLSKEQLAWVSIITQNAEAQKGVLAVIITSLTKKIENPTQDIRQHKVELPNGYSGRSYDTASVTPFMRSRFPRLAMSESGWLTRSIEQPHAFTLDFPGRIANQAVKVAFLQLLHDVQVNQADPKAYLLAIFAHLRQLEAQEIQPTSITTSALTLQHIMHLMEGHFYVDYGTAGASRLPVLAIYAMYANLMETNARYQDKQLAPLKRHTTSDSKSRSIGDIEILHEDGTFFEAVEVKHGIAIDLALVEKAFEKFKPHPVARYYLLTTADPNMVGEDYIQAFAQEVQTVHGCEIVVNGIMPTLKYYLRMLVNPDEFVTRYEQLVNEDQDLKRVHRERWAALKKRL